ncbi:unnamed protein product [Mytilus coruscus]|uniref:B box-type domain-containing protein n=1 Tax=Mytilus coruscus TaxID=42192 RepID=A0A6J8DNM5_MYTCO|nr:unnamed protein product [Mytilus coruscus]
MDTATNTLCGICDAQHVTKCANFWCPECDDALCTECNGHHSFSKASRHHSVIQIEDYRKLPTDISSIVHHCIEHEKKLQIFCPHHDQLCCLLGISTSHKDCTGMLTIEEMAITSKSNGLLESLQKSLEDLKGNIDNIVKDRQLNLAKIEHQKTDIHAGIKRLREKMNSHFDKLEQEISKELNATEWDLKTKIEDLLKELKEKSEKIAMLQNNILDFKNHASDVQILIGSKTLEKKIDSVETYVQSLSEDERLKQLSLKCTYNEGIEDLLTRLVSFGTASVESSPRSVKVTLEKNKQAQIISSGLCPKSVDKIRSKLIREFQIPKGKSNEYNINGSAIFPNRKIVFTDCENHRRLVILNEDGSLDCEIPLSELMPFDVACIDDTTVAFTVWDSSEIYIFDLRSKSIKKQIQTNKVCFGITYDNGMIYYCNEEHLGVAQLKDSRLTTIAKFDNLMGYVTTSGEMIYFTDYDTNSVFCFNIKGKKIWEYKEKTVLDGPNGVAVDKNGIVYVASENRHCIVAISPDGEKAVNFLSSADGIETPYKIICENERNLLRFQEPMETPTDILCGICDAQHVTKCADFWCPECDDGLCTECKTHHSFSKSSRHHDVISLENYIKLPTDISSIFHHCTEHEKKFYIYCPHHDLFCCHLCLSTSHKECTGMLSVEEIAKTSKSSGLLESLQKSLEDMKSNIDNVVKDRQSNLIKIKEEQQNIHAGIKQLRKRINSHFDKLEQKIVEELNAAELDMKMKIEDLFKELREKSESIAVLQSSKTIEKKIQSDETYIQSLTKDVRLKQLSLKYSHNEEIENLFQSITSFGLMSKESSPPCVEIKLEKNKQAQILTASFIPKSVDNVCAKLVRKFQIPQGKNQCDTNMRLVIFSTDGSLDYEIPLSNLRPFDVACIDDTTVAFTVVDSSEIHIFDVKSKIFKNTIQTNSSCFGITCKDTTIYYGNRNSVGYVQINDNSSSSLVNLEKSISYFCYVTSFGELLYFSNHDADSVSCFSFKGEKLWEFTDETFLYGPAGVAVDRNGIVYVATANSHGIMAISPDGKKVADVLTSEDGIENPYKLFCDSSRDVLLVAEYNGNCALFEIK